MFNQMIRELCAELDITYVELSDGWVFRLSKSGRTYHIIGNRFDLNLSASSALADDKVSTYEVLHHANVPAVPHYLFYNENFSHDSTSVSPRLASQINSTLSTIPYPIVVKPNHGSRGRDVYLCHNSVEAHSALQQLLHTDETIAYCPFFEAPYEYRCFFLDGQILLIYRKNRTNSWQHNLSRGAKPQIIPSDSPLFASLSSLASRAGTALNIRFATIDILENTSGEQRVLEINQGITTSIFSQTHPDGYELSKNIYRAALKSLFML